MKRLPLTIYTDFTVIECATDILIILDALSELNANLLGQAAEQRFSTLTQQYGLRDSQNVQAIEPWVQSYPVIPQGGMGTVGLGGLDHFTMNS